MNRAALFLWLAVAIAGGVAMKCAAREPAAKAQTPEQMIESNPTGAGELIERPGYFRKATP